MHVSSIQNGSQTSNITFGRALTSAEEKIKQDLVNQAKSPKNLNIKDTLVIGFDAMLPSEKGHNTGIGTTFDKAGVDFLKFLKKAFDISGNQLEPQGIISRRDFSPFSGSVFAIGPHLISLKKLTTPEYGEVLSTKTYDEVPRIANSERGNYKNLLMADGPHMEALREAHTTFRQLPDSSPLKAEFNEFLKNNDERWLDRDALYEALSAKHGNDYWKTWNDDLDKNLFSSKYDAQTVNDRIAQIKQEYGDVVDFHKFVQFIASKQQQEAKTELNKEGIKLSGDCLIGFSKREQWAYPNAFVPGKYLGCWSNGKVRNWGLPAPDYNKLGTANNLGETGQLLKKKLDIFFERYDMARIDAAWQLVKPFLVEPKGEIADVDIDVDLDSDEDRDVVISEDENSYSHEFGKTYLGDSILKIIEQSAREHGVDTRNIAYEFLGVDMPPNDPILKGRTQIHSSLYQDESWGSTRYLKSLGLTGDDYIFGTNTHDDPSMIDVSRDLSKNQSKTSLLSESLNWKFGADWLASPLNFMRGKWAEIFTTTKNFFTTFDALGMNVKYNTQKINPRNWKARVPENYEELYHRNLRKGVGLNHPYALADAMNAKDINHDLRERLYEVGRILASEDGPMTQKDADKQLGKDFVGFKFN